MLVDFVVFCFENCYFVSVLLRKYCFQKRFLKANVDYFSAKQNWQAISRSVNRHSQTNLTMSILLLRSKEKSFGQKWPVSRQSPPSHSQISFFDHLWNRLFFVIQIRFVFQKSTPWQRWTNLDSSWHESWRCQECRLTAHKSGFCWIVRIVDINSWHESQQRLAHKFSGSVIFFLFV